MPACRASGRMRGGERGDAADHHVRSGALGGRRRASATTTGKPQVAEDEPGDPARERDGEQTGRQDQLDRAGTRRRKLLGLSLHGPRRWHAQRRDRRRLRRRRPARRIGLGPPTHRVRRLVAQVRTRRSHDRVRRASRSAARSRITAPTCARSRRSESTRSSSELFGDAIEPGARSSSTAAPTSACTRCRGPGRRRRTGPWCAVEACAADRRALRENVTANGFEIASRSSRARPPRTRDAARSSWAWTHGLTAADLRTSGRRAGPFVEVAGVNLDEVMAGRSL